jgi:hypothetical protein
MVMPSGGVTSSVPETATQAPTVAEMMGVCKTATGLVVMVKTVPLCPGAIITDAGTLAARDELPRLTICPPTCATELSVTLPIKLLPPMIDAAERINDPGQEAAVGWPPEPPELPAGLMVSPADTVFADVAVIVAIVVEVTGVVVIGNDPLDCPSGTVTEGGTPAAVLLLDSVAVTPPEGAGADNVSVPVAPCPPVTVEGTMVRLVMVPVCPPLLGAPTNTKQAASSASVSAGHTIALAA